MSIVCRRDNRPGRAVFLRHVHRLGRGNEKGDASAIQPFQVVRVHDIAGVIKHAAHTARQSEWNGRFGDLSTDVAMRWMAGTESEVGQGGVDV